MIEVRVDVQRGPHHQQRLKLVQRGADVTREAQTPDLQQRLQVKEHGEGHLEPQSSTATNICSAHLIALIHVEFIFCINNTRDIN